MLVTFHTKAYANITMFGDVAETLLKLMGHSGTIPSAIAADDVPEALSRLRAGLASHAEGERDSRDVSDRGDSDDDEQQRVGLDRRAYPLIQLLEAAASQGCPVSWR